jgi:hypothetical protein
MENSMRKLLFVAIVLVVLVAASAARAQMSNKLESTPYLAKTADFTLASGPQYLGGWSIREAAASAAVATVIIRNGSDTDSATGGVQCAASGGSTQVGGQALAFIELAANGSSTETLSLPVNASNGLCADIVAGEVDIAIYLAR